MIYYSAPNCKSETNRHELKESQSQYYAECEFCGEKFVLLSKTVLDKLNISFIERPLIKQ